MDDLAELPDEGIDKDDLLETMRGFKEADVDWEEGRTWSLVYYADDEHYEFLKKAHNLFFSANGLNPMAFKSLKKMEAEVVRMTADMLNGDEEVCGTMTSGGTESILMAVKAARDRASFIKKLAGKPEIVAPQTIHPAFAKAAHYFGAKMNYVPVDDDFRADPQAMADQIGRKTMLVAASAPQYAHGMVDPIEEIAAVTRDKGVPFHVDACFGGFLLPWLEELGYDIPTFDFRIPGVTSMSADVHKYGYAAKGASTVLYKDMSYLKHQFFAQTEFPGGIYISPTMAGTRPGGAIAAAWASMKALGRDGYTEMTDRAMQTADELQERIAEIPTLKILGSEHSTIVTYASADDRVDTFAIADYLQQQGWSVDRQHRPASIHCTVNVHNAPVIDEYIEDLHDAIAEVRQNPDLANEGEAAMYGMMAKLPFRGTVEKSVLKVMEKMYEPGAVEPDLSEITGGENAGMLLELVDKYGGKILEMIDDVEQIGDLLKRLRP
jgi:glutamate/tyrosine decarboxylase-like PLP-dependent enzyme